MLFKCRNSMLTIYIFFKENLEELIYFYSFCSEKFGYRHAYL